jgi:hypothetical protein
VMTRLERRRAKRLAALEKAEVSVPISFAMVGVQKAATTTFFYMLCQHPQVVNGPQKELRFFIEDRDWAEPDYSTYRRPVLTGGEIAGDATPAYLFWPHALERMRAYNPEMRLLASFRDPIERGFSQWAMERSRHGRRFPDLPEAIDLYADDPLPDDVPRGLIGRPLQRSMFVRGLYGAQLERAFESFPAEQWLFFEFRDLLADHVRHLDRTTDFLGLERFTSDPGLRRSMATPSANPGPRPSVAAVERLVAKYAADLPTFERLSGVSTEGWPTRQVVDGRLDVETFHARLCDKLGLSG